MKFNIQKTNAVYTGGNIWLFYGKLTDGNYFLTDDDGNTRILDSDPSDFDVTTYPEWQEEHLVTDLLGDERKRFCDSLCDYLQKASQKERGWMSDIELDGYRQYFRRM